MKINIKKAPRILIFGKICFISQKHQLPTHLPKKKPHLSILTTPKMNFPRLFDVLNILVLFLGASALRTWKHSPSSTSHASLTIDMLPDRPRLSYLSPAQLIHEVATVSPKRHRKRSLQRQFPGSKNTRSWKRLPLCRDLIGRRLLE